MDSHIIAPSVGKLGKANFLSRVDFCLNSPLRLLHASVSAGCHQAHTSSDTCLHSDHYCMRALPMYCSLICSGIESNRTIDSVLDQKMSMFFNTKCGYTGWPRKNATPTINNFKKTREKIKKLCALMCIEFFSQQMTPISLILMKAFWFYGRFSEAMSFSKFATSVSKVRFDVPKISIVWLPRVKCLLLLWKTKTAWIKRNTHYVTLQRYNPGEATQRNSSRPQSWLLIEKKQILKMTLPQKNGSRIKTPSSKLLILESFCW